MGNEERGGGAFLLYAVFISLRDRKIIKGTLSIRQEKGGGVKIGISRTVGSSCIIVHVFKSI
jgi:hypothetical protein